MPQKHKSPFLNISRHLSGDQHSFKETHHEQSATIFYVQIQIRTIRYKA